MNKIEVVSTKKSTVNKNSLLKNFLKEKVFSKDGEEIGRVQDIVFTGYEIDGIITAKARYFRKTFIGNEYIEKFSSEGILLKINPVTMVLGKQVFDKDGRKVGKVKHVNRKNKSNTIESLTVKKNFISHQHLIYPDDIEVIQKNVILKTTLSKNGQ